MHENAPQTPAPSHASPPNPELQSLMMARVRQAYIHPPLAIDAGASVFDAARLMKENKATSLLVRDGDRRLGIVTGKDLREGVILQRQPLETPVGSLATFELVTIRPDDFLFNAVLLMTKHAIRRVVVADEDDVLGVLEQVDLLGFLSNHSHIVAIRVERATAARELREASEDLVALIRVLHGNGAKIEFVTEIVTELNRKIVAKLYELLAPPDLVANSCLIVMGSEGRGEQILKTDQDNGLILRDGFAAPDLARVTAALTDGLVEIGYPLCPGGVMVSNPTWCKPLSGYLADLRSAIIASNEQALLDIAIFYDAAAVAGDATLLAGAKRAMFGMLAQNSAFYARFARAIDSFETPLGMFSNLILERGPHKDELDIKKGGIFPIVHGVRSLALERGLEETNTIARIRRLEGAGLFDRRFADELAEAYAFLLDLRLAARLEKLEAAGTADNFVRPGNLSKLERDQLKDTLSTVKSFKEIVRYHFRLGLF